MLLLHEAGHAWFVKRERLDRLAVRITAFHGECVYEAPDYAEQDGDPAGRLGRASFVHRGMIGSGAAGSGAAGLATKNVPQWLQR